MGMAKWRASWREFKAKLRLEMKSWRGKWVDYAYCIHCDRPLKESRITVDVSGSKFLCNYFWSIWAATNGCGRNDVVSGSKFLCNYCNKEAAVGMTTKRALLITWKRQRRRFVFRFVGYLTGPFLLDLGFCFLIGYPVPFWSVMIFCGEGLRKLKLFEKFAPIYDRWVKQHGTDPDKWPDPDLY